MIFYESYSCTALAPSSCPPVAQAPRGTWLPPHAPRAAAPAKRLRSAAASSRSGSRPQRPPEDRFGLECSLGGVPFGLGFLFWKGSTVEIYWNNLTNGDLNRASSVASRCLFDVASLFLNTLMGPKWLGQRPHGRPPPGPWAPARPSGNPP